MINAILLSLYSIVPVSYTVMIWDLFQQPDIDITVKVSFVFSCFVAAIGYVFSFVVYKGLFNQPRGVLLTITMSIFHGWNFGAALYTIIALIQDTSRLWNAFNEFYVNYLLAAFMHWAFCIEELERRDEKEKLVSI